MTKHFLSRDQDRPVRGHCLNDVKIQTTDLTATGVMKMEIRGLLKAYPEAAKREILNTLLSEFSASSTQESSVDDSGLARDTEIARLEFEVCEAAVKYREIFKWADSVPLSEFVTRSAEASDIKRDFNRATDALIAARKKVETQTLYNKVPDGLPPPAINNGVKQESPVWTGPPGSV